MFSCLFNRKPRDYYIEERNYESEKIMIDNNRLKLVCDGKIVIESGGFPESIKHAQFFAIDTRRFLVVILPREMIVLTQENLDEITKIKLDTTEIINIFDCFRPIYGIYIVYEKARIIYANFSRWGNDSYERI